MVKNSNDEKIFKLEEAIKEKVAKLEGATRFVPVTNCLLILPWTGVSVNLNVLDKLSLMYYLSQLTNMKEYRDANMPGEEILFGSWPIETWIEDLQNKHTVLNRKAEEKRLADLRKSLADLLSLDAKVDRQLADIESLI